MGGDCFKVDRGSLGCYLKHIAGAENFLEILYLLKPTFGSRSLVPHFMYNDE